MKADVLMLGNPYFYCLGALREHIDFINCRLTICNQYDIIVIKLAKTKD